MKIYNKIGLDKIMSPVRWKQDSKGYGNNIDPSITMLQATDGYSWKTYRGNEPTHSYIGPLVDDNGDPTTNPVTSRGLMIGGGWTNAIPAGNVETAGDANISVATVGEITTVTEVGTSSAFRYAYRGTITFTSGLTYTFSRKVKMGGRRFVQMVGASGVFGSTHYANFDLQLGAVAYSTNCIATITQEADGYYTIRVTVTATSTAVGITNIIVSIPAGDSVRSAPVTGINGIAFYTKHAMCVQSAYLYSYAPPGTTVPAASSTTGGNGTNTLLSTKATAALSGGPFTTCAAIYPGASSAQITTDANILAVRGVAADMIYLASGGTIKASDGTNTATVTVTDGWLQTDRLNIWLRTNTAGTQMQVGYTKNLDTTITWGSLATYKNTMTPGTHSRKALNGTIPMTMLTDILSNKYLVDSDCLKMLRYVK